MDAFLGKITSHAMNYAIRTGVGITASYAIKQTSRLLRTVDDNVNYRELQELQERLNSKIQIITPAIDMVEIISARGNTTLESAVTLTKALRRDIEALGIRLSKAASAEETSRKARNKAKSRTGHEAEIRLIVYDMKKLLTRLDNAIPEIQLAITTSGATLSTTLPATVSPSRLLQASTFLTAGDMQYAMNPGVSVQIGPAFTLSLYMLFAGHSNRIYEEGGKMRGATMKEVLHKARVKLMRLPLGPSPTDLHDASILQSIEDDENVQIRSEGQQNEYSYRIEIIEDLEDDRVHTFEEGDIPPGPYGGVDLAGIREFLPIHQISRIFYATTGKILGVESVGGTNTPVLLLKRDANAQAPRIVRSKPDPTNQWDDYEDEDRGAEGGTVDQENDEDDIDEQIRRESSVMLHGTPSPESSSAPRAPWSLPPNLDPEWLAVGVYTEEEDESSSDDEQEQELDANDDSAYASHRPSSSGEGLYGNDLAQNLPTTFSHINLNPASSPPSSQPRKPTPTPKQTAISMPFFPAIRSSLSLLEMLIRLTSLQQYQQTSHLAVPDELLTFFLEESSAPGAGAEEERKLMRSKATQRLGFDPYHESPIKRHGEDYQYQNGGGGQEWDTYSRAGTPRDGAFASSPRPRWEGDGNVHERQRSMTPQRGETPQTQPWLSRNAADSRRSSPLPGQIPSSPVSPYRPQQQRRVAIPTDRVQREDRVKGSPLGRGQGNFDSDPDSTLGLSPVSPTLVDGREKT